MKIQNAVPCKPRALWCLITHCKDSKWVGDIVRAYGGQDVDLDLGQMENLHLIISDAEAMENATEERRKNWREFKQKKDKRALRKSKKAVSRDENDEFCDEEECVPSFSTGNDTCPLEMTPFHWKVMFPQFSTQTDRQTDGQTDGRTDGRTDVTTQNVTVSKDTVPFRSVPLDISDADAERIGTERLSNDEFKKQLAEFCPLCKQDRDEIFNPAFHPAVIAAAITADTRNWKNWRHLATKLPDDVFRQECFTFLNELDHGERPENRGAALNARLRNLIDQLKGNADA